MDSKSKEFLFELLNAPSPSGFESEGQRIWVNRVQPFSDSVENDAYGNTWATLSGNGERCRVMLESHADEIGFMINNISESGYLYVTRIGGSDRTIARSRRLTILGDKGPVKGVIGITAIHLRDKENEKAPEIHELYIDIGASSRSEVEARGIRVGHPAVFAETAEELVPGRLIGRAIDNRISGFILSEVVAKLSAKENRPMSTLFAVNAVQEEIGGQGMRMIAYRLEPDLALVLDVTHATDSPGIDKNKHGTVKLGGGPTITHGTANHPGLVRRLVSLANELQIPIQHEASSRSTGTDTDKVYDLRGGIPSALISIPMRYMHSTIEMVDLNDAERCIELLTHFLRSLNDAEDFTPKLATGR